MQSGGAYLTSWLRRATASLAAGGWLALSACSGTHERAQAPASQPRGSIMPTTNVPALVGASIDGLRRRLGPTQLPPAGFGDPVMAASDSILVFRTGGLLLVASYDARSRQVRDLLLLGRHEDSLMARATLRASSPHYLVLPVFRAGSNNRLLGLRIIPRK